MSFERHQAQEENVGAYLLGALTEIEVHAFERHLSDCPVCRDELERLRPAVDALPRSVAPVEPPASLKASLMEAVGADSRNRVADSRNRVASPRPAPRVGLRERLAAALGGMRPAVALAGVAVVLMVGALTGYAVTQIDSGPDEASRTLAAKVDKGRIPSGNGKLILPSGKDKGAILQVRGMPSLDRSGVYQVWLKRGDEAISQSLFSVGRDGTGAAAIAQDLTGAEAVLVTRERAGGARTPSEEPVLSVAL